ncbi:MAG: CAP domain-containing protein [Chryseosolibacter sp.]
MKSVLFIAALLLLQGLRTIDPLSGAESICLSPEEKKLYDLITEYRKAQGLPAIEISAKLTSVAQTHARDLAQNYQFDPKNKCNPHSWSKRGKWSSCCYTSDHQQAKCMWDKPSEIAGYESPGYEIAYYSSAGASASEGLAGWKKSPAHNPLIINEGMWNKVTWKGIGIGIYKEYGIVWFGELEDKSTLDLCPTP